MTLKAAEVQDVIDENLSSCGALPVCFCDLPDDVVLTYWKVFSLVHSPSDLPQLKKILCCVLKGGGTVPVPNPSGTPDNNNAPPGTPQGTANPFPKIGNVLVPGMGQPAGSECSNWVTLNMCSLTQRAALKSMLSALKVWNATAMAGTAGGIPGWITPSPSPADVNAVQVMIDFLSAVDEVCGADPAVVASMMKDKVVPFCEKIKAIPIDNIPVIGKLKDNATIIGFLNACCG